ncbi:olfactory receptor 5AR1-like [Leptodactylus fuscus]|uniref:olfactory receptor 5AR1-like n=1 Tax=Leptodactylus fuscus TaxID=238119 RepID=UPI003F4F197E
MNKTQATMFVFSGLTNEENLVYFFFAFFLQVYIITVVGNVGIMVIVYKTSTLHTPMYYFLSWLSVVDLFYSSVVVPKMISDLISIEKVITFQGCALQFFFFASFGGTEVLLLSIMSYDRYAAICHPLHYVSIMTRKKCFHLVILAFSLGILQSAALTSCVFSLEYCASNLIDHFYCDIPPVLKLSCSDTFTCDMVTVFIIGSLCACSFTTILVSYIFIFFSILQIRSSKGREKAFSTCSSHLICCSIFFVPVFLTYMHPPEDTFKKEDKLVSIFYVVMTPMLNPLIYRLRNQEVKKVIVRAIYSYSIVSALAVTPKHMMLPTRGPRGGAGFPELREVRGNLIISETNLWDKPSEPNTKCIFRGSAISIVDNSQ